MKYLLAYWSHGELDYYYSNKELESIEIIEDYYIGEDSEEYPIYKTVSVVSCVEMKQDIAPLTCKMVNYFAENIGKNVLKDSNLWFTSEEHSAFVEIWKKRVENK